MTVTFTARTTRYQFHVDNEAPVQTAVDTDQMLEPNMLVIEFDTANRPTVKISGIVYQDGGDWTVSGIYYCDQDLGYQPLSDLPAWAHAALEEVTNRR